jgi:2',3'-cyclic-nucleotide 2'-phosphodiesterase (5'-nucleotidase family)
MEINKWKDKLKTITEEKVCIISKSLTRSYGEESSLGNMITDAMMHAYPDNDFAITNSGGLRQDIDSGSVTVGNLISAFPFPNTVVKVELKGEAIKKLFEHAASLSNGILQVSKQVVFVYNEKNPVGSRVISIHINGKLLENDKTYKVLTNNFLADGGDGYIDFKNAISKKNTQEVLMENMKRYLSTFTVYNPILEGRIIVQK